MKKLCFLFLIFSTVSCSLTRDGSFLSDIRGFFYRSIASINPAVLKVADSIETVEKTVQDFETIFKDEKQENGGKINIFTFRASAKKYGLSKYKNIYTEIKAKLLMTKVYMLDAYRKELTPEEKVVLKGVAMKYYSSIIFAHTLYYFISQEESNNSKDFNWEDLDILSLILPAEVATEFKIANPLSVGNHLSPPTRLDISFVANIQVNGKNPLKRIYGQDLYGKLNTHFEKVKKVLKSLPGTIKHHEAPHAVTISILDKKELQYLKIPGLIQIGPSYDTRFATEMTANQFSSDLKEFNKLTQLAVTRETYLAMWSLNRYKTDLEPIWSNVNKGCCGKSLTFKIPESQDLLDMKYYQELNRIDFISTIYPEITKKAFKSALKYPIGFFKARGSDFSQTKGRGNGLTAREAIELTIPQYQDDIRTIFTPKKMSKAWKEIMLEGANLDEEWLEKWIDVVVDDFDPLMASLNENNQLYQRTDYFHHALFHYDELSPEYISLHLALKAFEFKKPAMKKALIEFIVRDGANFDSSYRKKLEREVEKLYDQYRLSYVSGLAEEIFQLIKNYFSKSYMASVKKRKKLQWIKKNVKETQILRAHRILDKLKIKEEAPYIHFLRNVKDSHGYTNGKNADQLPEHAWLDIRSHGELLGIVIKQISSQLREFGSEFQKNNPTTKVVKEFFQMVKKRYERFLKKEFEDQEKADIRNYDDFHTERLSKDLSLILWRAVFYSAKELYQKYPYSDEYYLDYLYRDSLYYAQYDKDAERNDGYMYLDEGYQEYQKRSQIKGQRASESIRNAISTLQPNKEKKYPNNLKIDPKRLKLDLNNIAKKNELTKEEIVAVQKYRKSVSKKNLDQFLKKIEEGKARLKDKKDQFKKSVDLREKPEIVRDNIPQNPRNNDKQLNDTSRELKENFDINEFLASSNEDDMIDEKMGLEEKLHKLIGYDQTRAVAEDDLYAALLGDNTHLASLSTQNLPDVRDQKSRALFQIFQMLGLTEDILKGKKRPKTPTYKTKSYVQYYQALNTKNIANRVEPFLSTEHEHFETNSWMTETGSFEETVSVKQPVSQKLYDKAYNKETGEINYSYVDTLFDDVMKKSEEYLENTKDDIPTIKRFCEADYNTWENDDDFRYLFDQTEHLRNELVLKANQLGYQFNTEEINKKLTKKIRPFVYFVRYKLEPAFGWILLIAGGLLLGYLFFAIVPFASAIGAAFANSGFVAGIVKIGSSIVTSFKALGAIKIFSQFMAVVTLKDVGVVLFYALDILWLVVGVVMGRHYLVNVHPAIQFQRQTITAVNFIDSKHLHGVNYEISDHESLKKKISEYKWETVMYLGGAVLFDLPFAYIAFQQAYKGLRVSKYHMLNNHYPAELFDEATRQALKAGDKVAYIPREDIVGRKGQFLRIISKLSPKTADFLQSIKPAFTLKMGKATQELLPKAVLYDRFIATAENSRQTFLNALLQMDQRIIFEQMQNLKKVLSSNKKAKPHWHYRTYDKIKTIFNKAIPLKKIMNEVRYQVERAVRVIFDLGGNVTRRSSNVIKLPEKAIGDTMKSYLAEMFRLRKYQDEVMNAVRNSDDLYEELMKSPDQIDNILKDIDNFLGNLEEMKPHLQPNATLNKNVKALDAKVLNGNKLALQMQKSAALAKQNKEIVDLLINGKRGYTNDQLAKMAFLKWIKMLEENKLLDKTYEVITSSGFVNNFMGNRGIKFTLEAGRAGVNADGIQDAWKAFKNFVDFQDSVLGKAKVPLNDVIKYTKMTRADKGAMQGVREYREVLNGEPDPLLSQ